MEAYIRETYGCEPDYPWMEYPANAVFRHPANQKWFALVMDVERQKLGLPGEGTLEIVNLKCDPILMGSLRTEPGFFPAYHMNKERWISAALDGTAPDDRLRLLLDISYELTNVRPKRKPQAGK